MPKIRAVSELPSWFDLANYQASYHFNAEQWLFQLERRQDVLKWRLTTDLTEDDYEVRLWRLVSSKEGAEAIRQYPVQGGPDTQHSSAIRPVTTYDLMRQMDSDTVAVREQRCKEDMLKRWQVISDPEAFYNENLDISKIPIQIDDHEKVSLPSPLLQIDLEASDIVLKNEFEAWLKSVRATQPASGKKARKMSYDRWARYGVLPYLDLTTWALQNSMDIDLATMSAAVRSYDLGPNSFSATVVPLAHELMTDLSKLRRQAAFEAANKESPPSK